MLRTDARRTALAIGLVGIVYALPLVGLMRYQGPPMEEGFMLAFPQQIMAGRLPHRDFLHLYGPGSLWALAGVYKVFGDTLEVERIVGLIQLMMIGYGVFFIAKPWGRRIAVVAGAAAAIIILPPTGLSAMAWNGAVGFGLIGLAVGTAARRLAETQQDSGHANAKLNRRIERQLVISGLLGGLALLFRPDLIIAIVLSFGAVIWGLDRRRQIRLVAGMAATTSLYFVLLATSGVSATIEGIFLEPVFKLRGGRSLPVPPSWDHLDGYLQKAGGLRVASWPLPMLGLSKQVFLWFFITPVAALFVLGVAIHLMRKRGNSLDRTLLAAGLFAAGIIPQGLQRPDTAHFAWVSCVGLALAPVALRALLDSRPGWNKRPTQIGDVLGLALVAVVLVGVVPFFSVRTYVDLTGQSFGHNRFGYEMSRGPRRFYYGSPEAAADAQHIINVLDRVSKPGQSLFVGPVDLRKTPYSDAFFYYLFPELPPATRYIEMDPGMANAKDSGMAKELEAADWVILSDVWSNWDEPNTSRDFGPNDANLVIKDRFCAVEETHFFKLLRPC